MGGEDSWAAGDRLYLLNLLVISPDKPRGPKRHVTNAGVNIRPIPPIYVVSSICMGSIV